MPRHKFHHERIYQLIGEPAAGAMVAGYVRYSSEMQDATTIVTQKRLIQEYAARKGWVIARWYEEPEQSAKYEEIERRPVFAQLLADAGADFAVVLCYVNNRWARNAGVAFASLNQLRRKRVWWATADELWDIDKVQQDGFDVAFAVDTQMNAAYLRQLSKRVIDAKEDRARAGYHNAQVPFGYLPPEYPKAPNGAPSTWKPPRMPVRIDPANFPALVRIGELAAKGRSDTAIADELAHHVSVTPRFGERALSRDTIAAIRRMWFPREFAPGCGHGTIETPSGDLVEGRHSAAWPYALWQRIVESKANQYRRPNRESQSHLHEFSRIIVCAGCHLALRASASHDHDYYRDFAQQRRLPCPASGSLSVPGGMVARQFGVLLSAVQLPHHWRDVVTDQQVEVRRDVTDVEAEERRAALEEEQNRFVSAFAKGYLTEQQLDAQVAKIRAELQLLPTPFAATSQERVTSTIVAGEALLDMAAYWSEATPVERRDIVWSIVRQGGLVYDLERRVIVGLTPRSSILPVLALGLNEQWEQRGDGLWLKAELLPTKVQRQQRRNAPDQHKPSPEQRQEARRRIAEGQKLREVAEALSVSRMAIWRAVREESEK